MSFHKILCAVDFSEGSTHALRTAARLAVRDHATLVLVHVITIPVIAYAVDTPLPVIVIEAQLEAGRKKLVEVTAEARALGATDVTAVLERGAVAEVVTAMLADPAFDLCVVGTHGRTGLARVALGSVAEKVIRHAPCPVLAARVDDAGMTRHILCPVDFSPSSARAAELAAHLIDPDGTVTLLHVLELPVRYAGELSDPDLAATLAPESNRLLAEWTERLRSGGVTSVQTASRIGYPGAQILHELDRDESIGLVVMGSHGRTWLGRMILGSVAEKVTRHARCSVLVAHPR